MKPLPYCTKAIPVAAHVILLDLAANTILEPQVLEHIHTCVHSAAVTSVGVSCNEIFKTE